ncbi:MAG: response regulator [Ignavibacteriaceae bacterium]|jgi:sigma-B regulation protein RsbU (phosphoserine phosphatase)|nr:response regulator [Ignavibacteriaceae bacterium]
MEKDKILLVEDEKDTRFILERLLTKNNYEVLSAKDGSEALKLLENYLPKAILADWTMPVMDGIELCKILKKDEKFKTIYFIVLTARASLKDRITGLDIGADDFLVKPIENQELLARIRSGVRIFNLQNELKNLEHNKAIIEMACTIGHKINNPLSSLLISVKNIETELLELHQSKFSEDLMIITQSIDRIKTLTESLVNIQKPTIIDYSSGSKMIDIK